uniref:Uncharacterized protein n=1 Tax=Romanomermis culicivorax TaxID=13658 RepID=A0A915HHS1_ROMCU
MDLCAGALQYIGADGVMTWAMVLPMNFSQANCGVHREVSPYVLPKSAQTTTTTPSAPLCGAKDPFSHPSDGPSGGVPSPCQCWLFHDDPLRKTLKFWRYWYSVVEAVAWLLLGGFICLFDWWTISDQWSGYIEPENIRFFQRKMDHNRLKWEQSSISKSNSSSDRLKELKEQLGSVRYKDDDPTQIEQYLILKQLYKHKKPEPRKRLSFP